MCAFLEALIAKDPSRAGLMPGLRCTANGVEGPLGSASVWGQARRIPARQTFVDIQTQSAIFMGVLTNTTSHHASLVRKDWFYAVRLRFQGNTIAEVEEVFFEGIWAHYPTDPATVEMDPRFEMVLPEGQRSSRAEMTAAIEAYCAAVARTGPADAVPFHPDTRRTELGQPTTDSWNFPFSARADFANEGWTWRISNIRIPVVDETRGVALAIFALSMDNVSNPEFSPCIVVEAFKFEDGLIRRMFAVYHAGSGDDGWK